MTLAKDEMRDCNRVGMGGSEPWRIIDKNKKDSIQIMKDYLLLKFDLGDWHGVSDAAMDIREMEARTK